MSQQQPQVEYIYDTSTYDLLLAEKFRNQNSILGGGSQWFMPSMKLFDGMKKMYDDPRPGFRIDDMAGVGEEGHRQRVGALKRPLGNLPHSDIEGIAAALEPPDEERGVPKRVLISNNPQVRELMRQMGGNAVSPEVFARDAERQGLIGKKEKELLEKSQGVQKKKLKSIDVEGARQSLEETENPNDMRKRQREQDVAEEIKPKLSRWQRFKTLFSREKTQQAQQQAHGMDDRRQKYNEMRAQRLDDKIKSDIAKHKESQTKPKEKERSSMDL